eukprot:TRINITY_DN2635_c0_g1_i2.p1 TRINITY_DN2635_c0_g1~~TRINITY_DN2635_c0_g1_i2.p1  ORF type:complete len:911 (+),score=212.51 TRINITY_DN2635_c0_g1_i2:807-3539(+)
MISKSMTPKNYSFMFRLCTVLFDALTNTWAGTEKENFVDELYAFQRINYLNCLECGYQSTRETKCLDLNLTIKGFGQEKAYSSIQESLRSSLVAETLEGDNQYSCETCGHKTDAKLGEGYSSFPYILTLHMRRFDFDFMSMQRVKLNDRVSFPEILDMNPYVHGAENYNEDDEEDTFDNEEKRSERLQRALSHGPYVYELFAVLIHSGTAHGGHYYGYMKSFQKAEWYCFNDSSVTNFDPKDIPKSFGSSSVSEETNNNEYGPSNRPGMGMSMGGSNGTNAYMLMYRQYDPVKNKLELPKESIPEELKIAINDNSIYYTPSAGTMTMGMGTVTFTLRIYFGNEIKLLQLDKSTTMMELKEKAIELYDLKDTFQDDCIRLREYDSMNNLPGKPLEIDESTLAQGLMFSKPLYIETKNPGEEFEEYDFRKMQIFLNIYNEEEDTWDKQIISISKSANLQNLKYLLQDISGIPPEEQLISKADYSVYNAVVLIDDERLLTRLKLFEGGKIYLERKLEGTDDRYYDYNTTTRAEEDQDKFFPKGFEEIDRIRNTITVNFNKIGSEEFDQSIQILRTSTLGQLKHQISQIIEVPMEYFKIMKGAGNFKYELKDEESTLNQLHVNSSERLTIIEGEPLSNEEVMFKFYDFRYNDLAFVMTSLFEIPIPLKNTIAETKVLFLEKYKELVEAEGSEVPKFEYGTDPSRLRMRSTIARYPSIIRRDDEIIDKLVTNYYTMPCLSVQLLPEGETEQKTILNVSVFVQQFFPERFEFGEKKEIYVQNEDTLESFRERLHEMSGCENIAITASQRWDCFEVLKIEETLWFLPPGIGKDSDWTTSSKYVRALQPRDGDVLFFRDATVPFKKLSAQEAMALRSDIPDYSTTYSTSSMGKPLNSREKTLKIQQEDVSIQINEETD